MKECCKQKKYYWSSVNYTCLDPAVVFGEGCLETDGERCTKCTSQRCCKSNEYYDYNHVLCRPCSDYGDNCEVCDHSQCLSCGNDNDEVGLTIDWDGNCVGCEDMFGEGCLSCSETECSTTENGYVNLGINSIRCNDLFGACDMCISEGCTDCEDGFQSIHGYCRECSEMFGDLCSTCDENKCTSCSGNGILINNVCVENCASAFGKGCIECNSQTCLRVEKGYFIGFGYSISCNVLPLVALGRCWNGAHMSIRDSRNFMKVRDSEVGENIDILFEDTPYTIPCDNMTDNCQLCSIQNSQAMCAVCKPGFVLVGGVCKSCDEHIPGGECLECSLTGCTSCKTEGDEILASGICTSCGNGFMFDESSRSCVSCSSLYGLCSECNENGCTACQGSNAILVNNKCVTCAGLHGQGCTECNSTTCITCNNDKCCPDDEKIIVVDGVTKCGTCKSFDKSCNMCNSYECVSCGNGKILNPTTKKCSVCQDIFEGCGSCNSDTCKSCVDPKWTLTENGCFKPDKPLYIPTDSSHMFTIDTFGIVLIVVTGVLYLLQLY